MGLGLLLAGTSASAADEYRHHISVGISGSPFLMLDVNDGWTPYLGVSLLPELRYSYSLDPDDSPRFWIAGRWSALSTSFATANVEVPAERASDLVFMGALGIAFKLTLNGTPRQRVTTSMSWLSLGLGFGNFKTKDERLIMGPAFLVSMEADALSFNLGN